MEQQRKRTGTLTWGAAGGHLWGGGNVALFLLDTQTGRQTDRHDIMKIHAAIAAVPDKYIDLDFLPQVLQLLCAVTGAALLVARLSYVVHTADWTRQESNTNLTTQRLATGPVRDQSKPLDQGPVRV